MDHSLTAFRCPIISRDTFCDYQQAYFSKAKPCIPTGIVMVGGPGSGKGSAQKRCIEHLKHKQEDFVVIDPDKILHDIFSNHNECRWIPKFHDDETGDPNQTGYDVGIINDLNFDYGIEHRYNLVFDGTGKNFPWTYEHVIQKLKAESYRVIVCINLLDVELALTRVKQRAKKTGRNVPEKFLRDTYIKLLEVIPQYLKISHKYIDAIVVYDNTNELTLLADLYYNDKGIKKVICNPEACSNALMRKLCSC